MPSFVNVEVKRRENQITGNAITKTFSYIIRISDHGVGGSKTDEICVVSFYA